MPRHNVSRDLKARIPYLAYVEGFKVKEIGQLLGVKKSMIYQTLNYYRKYGVTFNPNAYMDHSRGRHRILDTVDVRFIKSALDQEPCLYLDELQELILIQRGIHVSVPTLFRTLRRIHFSRKDVSIHALERNDMDRAIYMNNFANLVSDPAMVMFIDEAARNKKNPTRKKGWSLTGRRCFQRRCFVRGKRYSILPVLTLDGIIAHDIIPGSVTSERFVQFLREHVVRKSKLHFLFQIFSSFFC
jgi:transposase